MEFTIDSNPKMLRETLCIAQGMLNEFGYEWHHGKSIQLLIDECDRMRPLGPDGKHGNLHTDECGCEDK